MTVHALRPARYALAALTAAAVITVTILALARPGRPPTNSFPPLVPAAAPASWTRAVLPGGTAVLSYPPSLRQIHGDTDAASAASLGPGSTIQLYLNATPRQGTESLAHWAAFRLALLRSDDAASAREVAASEGVKFRGATGSCVIDAYVTRIGAHHYEEIACLVQGRTSASVIVAAAPAASWARAFPLLFQAVAAYLVR